MTTYTLDDLYYHFDDDGNKVFLLNELYDDRGSLIDPVLQGASLGWSDEIAGAIGGTVSRFAPEFIGGAPEGVTWSDEIERVRDDWRRDAEEYEKRNPGLAMAAEVAGGMATGGYGAARATGAAAIRNMPQLKQLLAIGAGEGAIAGAGSGEGLVNSILNAGGGAVAGGLIGFAGHGLERAGKFVAAKTPANRWATSLKEQIDNLGVDEVNRRIDLHQDNLIADISPEFRGMASYVGNTRGGRDIAANVLESRQGQMNARINEAASELSDRDYYQQITALSAQRSAAAKANYESIRGMPVQVDESMVRAATTPDGVKAAKTAETRLKNRYQLDDLPDGMAETVEYWDEWKKAMDGTINKYARAGDNAAAKVATEIKNTVVNNVDVQTNYAYQNARQQFAEASGILDAMKEGRGLFSTTQDPEEVIQMITNMTPDQRDGFLSGVVREISKRAGDKPETANSAWSIIRSPNFQNKMRAAIGNDTATDKFIKTMRQLGEQNQTFNVVTRGSRTAPIQQAGEEIEQAAGVVGRLAQGDAYAVVDGLKTVLKKQFRSMSSDDVEKMARFLFSRGQNIDEILQTGAMPEWMMPVAVGGISAYD